MSSCTPLWNASLSWDTNEPRLSSCFQQTVLVYPSLVFLLASGCLQIILAQQSSERNTNVMRELLPKLRILGHSLNIGLKLIDLFLVLFFVSQATLVDILAAVAHLVFFTLLLLLYLYIRVKGKVTSFAITLSLFVHLICSSFSVLSIVLVEDNFWPKPSIILNLSFVVEVIVSAALLLLSCWPDPPPEYRDVDEDLSKLTPEKYASFVSRTFFSWYWSFAWLAFRRGVGFSDLMSLTHNRKCAGLLPPFERHYSDYERRRLASGRALSLAPSLLSSIGIHYGVTMVYQVIFLICQFVGPQMISTMISYVENPEEPQWHGYVYAVIIIAFTLLTTLFVGHCFFEEYNVSLKVKTIVMATLYRKSMKLSTSGKKDMTVGEIVNFMSIDTQKMMDFAIYLNTLWGCPFQIILALFFLWGVLGPSALAGASVMVFSVPLNLVLVAMLKRYQVGQMREKDKRSRMMDEILNGIKVLKLYAWESSFQREVLNIRHSEIKLLKRAGFLNAVLNFFFSLAPFLITLVSFGTFVLSDPNNVLDAKTAFVSLSLFNLLRAPLNQISFGIVFSIQFVIALRRVNIFMNSDELDPRAVDEVADAEDPIEMTGPASFAWETKPFLSNIDLKVKDGQLVAVVGSVGSGKSSLLSAILGEMQVVEGEVRRRGSLGYVSQQAWMKNATLKENILFGCDYRESYYNKIIECCALKADLESLQAGDATEIGEKGINLSGGQKQRISLARAVYANANVYLLDDPLSAVDSHVGEHIFDKVITGFLRKKTRILVTHALKYLPRVDRILVIKDGRIVEDGSYQELIARRSPHLAAELLDYLDDQQHQQPRDEQRTGQLDPDLQPLRTDLERQLGAAKVRNSLRRRAASHRTSPSDFFKSESHSNHTKPSESHADLLNTGAVHDMEMMSTGGALIEEENLASGGVNKQVYVQYIQAAGLKLCLGFTSCFVLWQLTSVFSSILISMWSTDPLAFEDVSRRNLYLAIYALTGIFQALFSFAAAGGLMFALLDAAAILHLRMLKNVLRAPMSYFDTTPIGRILNRFTKDMDIVDVTIPINIRQTMYNLMNVLGTGFVLCFANPIFIIVLVPFAIAFYCVQRFYLASARQTRRMESILRSPIFSHFGESVSGAVTIRAFKKIQEFSKENEKLIDTNQSAYYPAYTSGRWLSVRMETLGNLILLVSILLAIFGRESMDPGLLGLSLSYALNITGPLQFLVQVISETETNMVSVERILEYARVEQEAPEELPQQDPKPTWPESGEVVFNNYETRYREGLDLVLKGIDCHIRSGEKIGIVGRTGAGKSSLTLALFRIIEAAGGNITIDGHNISQMGLRSLRSKLTIIPQDPVVFSGSLRMNLDPFGKHSDAQLWRALQLAHLKAFVSRLPGGLNFQVSEAGGNLSMGQRQLMCLARALLRKTKILILDEATAAVDADTDNLIQNTIRSQFSDCTVIVIAHRLNTILDSSKVLVLDKGKVVEFDSPEALLDNKESIFYSMAKDADLVKSA